MKASIIILNYQGEKIIRATLESLMQLNFPKDRFEIIIVDNGSTDKSKEVIEKFSLQSPISPLRQGFAGQANLQSLFLERNLGFAAGNNVGMRKAKGEYIALLNNDCVVEKNWLKELIGVAEKDKKIFAVNSKIMLGHTNKIQNAGIRIFENGYARDIGAIPKNNKQVYEEDRGQYEKVRDIDAACGAAVLYRSSILNKIGFLEESFFLYYEDVELSERARVHGYKIVYAPRAVVHHIHAASSREGSPFFIFHSEKGRLLHMIYHGSLWRFFSEYFKFKIMALVRLLYGIRYPKKYPQQSQYIKIVFSLFIRFPQYFYRRIQLNRH